MSYSLLSSSSLQLLSSYPAWPCRCGAPSAATHHLRTRVPLLHGRPCARQLRRRLHGRRAAAPAPARALGQSAPPARPGPLSPCAEQYQELEQQVPSTEEEEQVPSTAEEEEQQMPQLMVQQSGMVEQLSAGELEFWSSIGVDMFKALTVLSRSSGAPTGSPLWSRNVRLRRASCGRA